MNKVLYFNGDMIPAHEAIVSAGSRGLRYGDGLFETIKIEQGRMPLFNWHMERLMQGMNVLNIQLAPQYTTAYLQESIVSLCKLNGVEQAGRVRLMVCRGNGTLSSVEEPFASAIIQADPLPPSYFTFNETGFTMGIYTAVQKSTDILSNLKSNNYLPYIMAAMHAQKNNWNDCLVLNTHGRICDATIANVFWVQDRCVYTTPLSEGGVAGVMRRYLLHQLQQAGYAVKEQPCPVSDLQQADELFLTNALYGIRWVRQLNEKLYSNQFSQELYNRVIKTLC